MWHNDDPLLVPVVCLRGNFPHVLGTMEMRKDLLNRHGLSPVVLVVMEDTEQRWTIPLEGDSPSCMTF